MFRKLLVPLLVLAGAAASAETLYDPTRPPVGASAPAAVKREEGAPLRVSLIIAGERRLARINDQWVSEGDRVAGAEVIRISPGSVRMRRDGRLFDLQVQGGGMRKQPSEPAG